MRAMRSRWRRDGVGPDDIAALLAGAPGGGASATRADIIELIRRGGANGVGEDVRLPFRRFMRIVNEELEVVVLPDVY